MTCRAPTSAVTCAGSSPTGAHLTYNAERRLSHWQNAPSAPTGQTWFLYDGAGQRVEQYVSGGSGSHTYYLPSDVEEVTPSGTLIKYYSAGGMTLGANTAHDASGIAYLASDGLGSVSEALSPSGSATGAHLYSPYGGVRYTSGTMPTAKGFTGQYSDAASTGLDYYGARYYDSALGQFTSADAWLAGGLNRYAYVGGNPETFSDPSGHVIIARPPMEGGEVYAAYFFERSAPTPQARRIIPTSSGADEITRALHLPGPASLDDMPSWNQVRANQYKASHRPKTTTDDGGGGKPGGGPGGHGGQGGGHNGGGSGGHGGNGGGTLGDGLPDRKKGDETRGILTWGWGEPIELESGEVGPASELPDNSPGIGTSHGNRILTWTHVESHAAALMRLLGIEKATLWLNNAPCPGKYGCAKSLPHMLPEGSDLTIYYKDAEHGISPWVELHFTGLSDSLWVPPGP